MAEVIRPKVLIVDDDPLNRSLLRRVLGTSYALTEAKSGPRALALVASEDPDVVLLDVMMPGVDGWTTLGHIRELTDVPVIMVTGRDSESEREIGRAHV